MGTFGTSEILIVLAVVLVLLGSTRLPNLARSIGRSARILRDETQGLRSDDPAPEGARLEHPGQSTTTEAK
ncbi:hypothetical protein GCM10009527_031720 [Actinomadura nitritigenes]|uniref:Sec-independent protein translocase protein TatA n=1 Tax=Actinomadura nitritigenes TaxID=134602 RepID=A0ABS3QUX3_9ACTN|nr:twin-arginine translocase TatA/TatE family subunit [Actinomadura nitritigenes]MBO2437567.1 twin-arginine translocase TatA/TatE family subunit [Actinomadura nitritigenes]